MNLIVDDNHVAYFFGFKIGYDSTRSGFFGRILGGGQEEVGVSLLNRLVNNK